jgi:precorrin-6B methylase 1
MLTLFSTHLFDFHACVYSTVSSLQLYTAKFARRRSNNNFFANHHSHHPPTPSSATAIAARVHWLVASVAVHHAGKKGRRNGGGVYGDEGHVEECVCVWAIDGLASAAVAGLARGMQPPGSAGKAN